MAGVRKGSSVGHSVVSQPVTLQVSPPEVEQVPVTDPAVVLMPAGLPPDLPVQALQTAMDALGIDPAQLGVTPQQLQAMAADAIAAGGITTAELVTGEPAAPPPSPELSPVATEVSEASRPEVTPDERLFVVGDMIERGDLALAVQQLTAVMVQMLEAIRTIGAQQQWMSDRFAGMGEMFATAAPILGGGGNPLSMLKKLATAMAAAGGRKEIEGESNG